jgi:PAS domain S-box-containing protein
VVDGLAQGILVADAEWNTIYTNPSFSRNSGYGGSELLGKKAHLIVQAQSDETRFRALLDSLQQKGSWSGLIRYHDKDGIQKSGQLSIQCLPPGMPLQACYVLELMGQDN